MLSNAQLQAPNAMISVTKVTSVRISKGARSDETTRESRSAIQIMRIRFERFFGIRELTLLTNPGLNLFLGGGAKLKRTSLSVANFKPMRRGFG